MSEKKVSLIVAASENGVIGDKNQLPWYISADLKRFRKLTTGHHLIMGRKTFESIGRLLPERTIVILTRNPEYCFTGAKIAASIEQAIGMTDDDPQPFIAGGAEIYRQSMSHVDSIYLTRVHCQIDGDTRFPVIDWSQWKLVQSERFLADKKNQFEYSFEIYDKA
jgi:dihydrofolate reductase